MARVYVYERPVDSVLTDVSFYEKHHLLNGVRVKQEPCDTDDKSQDSTLQFANSNVRITTSAGTTIEGIQLVDVVNNKENELVSSKNRAGIGKSDTDVVNTRKRKRLTFANLPETVPQKESRQHSCRSSFERIFPKLVGKEVRNSKVECDICYVIFRTESALKRHRSYYHELVARTCNKCYMICQSIDGLTAHKRLDECKVKSHSDWTKENTCGFCNRKFKTKPNFQSHVFHTHTELLQNNSSEASMCMCETDKSNKTDTTKETDKISEPPLAERTDDHVEHPSAQQKGNSPTDNLTKKMRQTTMIEFLSRFTKKEHISPNKIEPTRETPKKASPRQLERITGKVAETPKKTTVKKNGIITEISDFLAEAQKKVGQNGAIAEFVSTPRNEKAPTIDESYGLRSRSDKEKKPFVEIHMGSDEMMTLLHKKIKIESKDEYPIPRNESYNFRRVTRNSRDQPPSDVSTRLPFYRKRNVKGQFIVQSKQISARLKVQQLRAKFKCKDCKVNLVRCDTVVKTEIVDYVPSTPVNVCDDIEEVWRKKVNLKRIHVPLIKLNEPIKAKVNDTFQSSNRYNNPEKTNASQSNIKAKLRRIFRCKVCRKYFSSKERLYEHLEFTHVFYISSVCSAWYKSRVRLLRHYLYQHCVMKRMQCCVCFENFVSPVLLKRHMGLHCIKVLQSKRDKVFNKEVVKCNMNSRVNSCGACGKQFWLGACLSEHQQVCQKMKAQLQKLQIAQCLVKTSPTKKTLESPLAIASGTVTEQQPIKLSPVKDHPRGTESPAVALPKRLLKGVAFAKGYNINNTSTSKEKFSCTTCGAQFLTFQNLCLHERAFTNAAKFVCRCCNTGFTTRKLLQNHFVATHLLDNGRKYKYFCTFCTQGFVKKANLQIHTGHFHRGQTPIIPKPWVDTTSNWEVNTVCNVCNLLFESSERFLEHNMYYYKGQTFTCTFCNQVFQGMYMLNHHNKLVHYTEDMTKQYTYMCDICNEGFTQESQHQAHKLHVHSASSETDTQTLQDHTYAITIGMAGLTNGPTMKYNCEVCHMNFMVEEDLQQHQLEYSNTGDYLCSYCARKCPTNSILNKHESLSHTGGNFTDYYKCHYCEEVLSTCTALKCHEMHFHQKISNPQKSSDNRLIVNQSAKPPGNNRDPFVCTVCDMTFVTLEKLNHHTLEFSNVGQYSCYICSRRFSELYRLEVHKLKHSNLHYILSKYHCPICREGFANPVNVRAHEKHFHKSPTTDQLVPKAAQTLQAVGLNVESGSNSPTKTKSIMCPDCLVSYDSESALKRHQSRFLNEGRHVCEYCGRRFQLMKMLTQHLKRHTTGIERLKHACSECKDRFGNQVSRYQHIVHLHGKSKWKGDVPNFIKFRHDATAAAKRLEASSHYIGKPITTASPVSSLSDGDGRSSSPTDQLIYAGEPVATASPADGFSDGQERTLSPTNQQSNMTVAVAQQETSYLKLERDGKIIQGTMHDKLQSLTEGVINCWICGRNFTTNDDLEIHLKDAHVKICPINSEDAADSAKNDTDAVQIVWEKMSDAAKLCEDQSDSEVHILCSSYCAPIMNYDKTVANMESADLSVNNTYLKIKDFAKLV